MMRFTFEKGEMVYVTVAVSTGYLNHPEDLKRAMRLELEYGMDELLEEYKKEGRVQ